MCTDQYAEESEIINEIESLKQEVDHLNTVIDSYKAKVIKLQDALNRVYVGYNGYKQGD